MLCLVTLIFTLKNNLNVQTLRKILKFSFHGEGMPLEVFFFFWMEYPQCSPEGQIKKELNQILLQSWILTINIAFDLNNERRGCSSCPWWEVMSRGERTKCSDCCVLLCVQRERLLKMNRAHTQPQSRSLSHGRCSVATGSFFPPCRICDFQTNPCLRFLGLYSQQNLELKFQWNSFRGKMAHLWNFLRIYFLP